MAVPNQRRSDPALNRCGSGVSTGMLFEAAFGRARIGMAVTDPSGSFLEVNEAFCSFLGYSAAELLLMTFQDITQVDDLIESDGAMRSLVTGSSSEFLLDKRYVTASGRSTWGRVRGIAVRGEMSELLRVMVQIEDLTERQAIAAALARKETVDDLTGLDNRKAFYAVVRAALTERGSDPRRLSVLVVNVDRFHQINAGMGQAVADLVLREVGRRLRGVIAGHGTVARLGGDEFGVVIPGIASHYDGVALGIEIRRSLGDPYSICGHSVFVSVRFGVVNACADDDDAETLIGRATAAAKKAKTLSCGWAIHSEGADTTSRDALELTSDLRLAIDNGGLSVAYQPIVDGDGRLHCFEALARWHHPRRGPVPPDQFIGVAEHNGLIASLTHRIATGAIAQAAAWGCPADPVRVAVNLSGQLLTHPDLVRGFADILRVAAFPPEALTIEITETALVEVGDPVVWSALDSLRSTGIRISLDDFGTGYSSLSYLKSLPVEELKIDRSFITDLGTDPRSEWIVGSITDLAHNLGVTVVAEGVESDTAAAHLLRLGVDFLQGVGIAMPRNAAVTTEWLRRHAGAAGPACQL